MERGQILNYFTYIGWVYTIQVGIPFPVYEARTSLRRFSTEI